jgi:hypothetical protein
MMPTLRRLGIALGSFVAAWLVIALVAGVLIGETPMKNPIAIVAAVVLGALVYLDSVRRESQRS